MGPPSQPPHEPSSPAFHSLAYPKLLAYLSQRLPHVLCSCPRVTTLDTTLHAGHVMINRVDRRSQLKCLQQCIELLNKGAPVLFFPEGTRSRDKCLAGFKKGAFSVACKAGVDIVPITLIGTGERRGPRLCIQDGYTPNLHLVFVSLTAKVRPERVGHYYP